MAGTARDIQVTEIMQGPGDLWAITTAPGDGAPRIVLAADGTPDSTAHGASVHLGAIAEAVTTQVKPKTEGIVLDMYDAPVALYATGLDASIEATLAQITMSLLQRALGVGTYSAGAGYKQVTFGGTDVVPEVCIAAISKKRMSPNKHVVSCLYKAVATGGFQLALGRAKAAQLKVTFAGLGDPARAAGRQVGILFETLADAVGGIPTAKTVALGDIQQGPCDLWLISPAPTALAPRVALAADLTPDNAAHAGAKHLGATAGEVTVTVKPKIDLVTIDQCDAPVAAIAAGLEASIEAEMSQSDIAKLRRGFGIGVFTEDPAYKQVTFGGTNVPEEFCIAAVAPKRSDVTKAVCACLYRVSAAEGVQMAMSRTKANTYKVKFTGMVDPTRTAGQQTGIVWETV